MNECTRKGKKAPAAEPGKRRAAKRRTPRRRAAKRRPAAQPSPGELYWLPQGHLWDDVPESVRQAVRTVVLPAYERFVVQAGDELDRSIGITLVHLVWLEVCQQTHMALGVAAPRARAVAVAASARGVPRRRTASLACFPLIVSLGVKRR